MIKTEKLLEVVGEARLGIDDQSLVRIVKPKDSSDNNHPFSEVCGSKGCKNKTTNPCPKCLTSYCYNHIHTHIHIKSG
jgi:hypothetical protein